MATIDVKRSHNKSMDEMKKRAETLARKMEEKFSIQWKWDGDHIQFDTPSGAAKGTKGQVVVKETSVQVQIDLPFLLRAFKGKIGDKVEQYVKEAVS